MILKKLISWFFSLFKFSKTVKKEGYSIVFVPELPKTLDSKTLYVEGNEKNKDYWYAKMKCPCGCNDDIMLNLMDDVSPMWQISYSEIDFSITPSIWRTVKCKSHFWITNSNIIWA